MQTCRQDMRAALICTAASYPPLVAAFRCVLSDGPQAIAAGGAVGLGPWGAAAVAAGVLGYILVVDALMPIGRSKIDIARGAMRSLGRAMLRDDAWGLRVAIGLAAVIVVQVLSECTTKN